VRTPEVSSKYSLQILKDIGKISPDGMLIYNTLKRSVLCCNKALAKMLSTKVSDIMERGWVAIRKALKDDQEFLARCFEEFLSNSQISNLELRVVGTPEKYISVDAYLIGDGEIIVAFAKNITNAKEHMNYIVEFGARKNTILDAISHSLSGPLNVVNNVMDVLDRQSKTHHYRQFEQPALLIREKVQQSIDLINTFLKEEHVASPAIPVEQNRFDAMAKIKIVARRYTDFNPTKRIKVVGDDRKLFVTGDDVKFFQIVNNLVSNAVKYTNPTGEIIIDAREQDTVLVVSVKDDGIGIPEYLLPHLFKKNTPAARPGLRGEQSIGLGLHIVKKLVDRMKGSVVVKSVEGQGSTFTVAFPGMTG
jgi:two-component system sensor histidine kinase VicK